MASIWGFAIGNISGTIYFFFFQLIGFLLCSLFLSKKNFITRILCGSVLGSVLLQWIPALFAFIFQFSVKAHIAAALFCTLAAAILFYMKKPQENLFFFSFGPPENTGKETLDFSAFMQYYLCPFLYYVIFPYFTAKRRWTAYRSVHLWRY